MAETPKDDDAPVTPTPADDSLSAGAPGDGPTADGAAAAADDALAAGPEAGEDRESLTGAEAHDHIEGAESEVVLDAAPVPPPPTSPWSSPSKDTTVSSGAPVSSGASPASRTKEKPAPTKASGRGAGRVLVPLIIVVLVVGVGYATYPQWRDRVEPYAEMLGLPLPAAPQAVDAAGVAAAETAAEPAPAGPAPAPAPAEPAAAVGATPAPTSPPAASPPAASPPVASGGSEMKGADTAATPPPAEPAASAAEVAELAKRLAAAEQAIARLSNAEPLSPAPAPASVEADGDVAALGERVGDMETRLSALFDEMAIVRQGLGQADETDGVGALASRLSERLGDMDQRLSDLDQRLSALDQRFATLEQAPSVPTVSPEHLAALAKRLDDLSGQVNGDTEDLGRKIADLAAAQDQLSQRQAQGRDARERAGVFLFATNLLAATSVGSGGFVPELDAVRTAAPDIPAATDALTILSTHAGGVASKADLRSAFPAVAASVIDASIVGADDGVVGTMMTRIASLVTLRRTETAEGSAIDGAVNRAEAAVNAGDLDAALAALSTLDGDPAKVAASWVEKAKARAAVDGAVRALQALALAAASGS